METDVIRILKEKGIEVPEHHIDMVQNQWKDFLQLRAASKIDELTHHDIGLVNTIGGTHNE